MASIIRPVLQTGVATKTMRTELNRHFNTVTDVQTKKVFGTRCNRFSTCSRVISQRTHESGIGVYQPSASWFPIADQIVHYGQVPVANKLAVLTFNCALVTSIENHSIPRAESLTEFMDKTKANVEGYTHRLRGKSPLLELTPESSEHDEVFKAHLQHEQLVDQSQRSVTSVPSIIPFPMYLITQPDHRLRQRGAQDYRQQQNG
ncbi:hypothetical protein BD410DRAFT_807457 [Rickenella mellea]|uniref:Uncharacterized protein n=1 Tax=Rickenella mellea TaxID=50990 RepID=A0A4Y7PS33_9AGAM|nr:hypothetical protein BD410DRAFT_807457 [Rickenella mellea]